MIAFHANHNDEEDVSERRCTIADARVNTVRKHDCRYTSILRINNVGRNQIKDHSTPVEFFFFVRVTRATREYRSLRALRRRRISDIAYLGDTKDEKRERDTGGFDSLHQTTASD